MLVLEQIPELQPAIARRELKRAEVLLARFLRGGGTPLQQEEALLIRARVRLMAGRVDEALDDLQHARALDNGAYPAEGLELLGDCHFARFELASVGFADRLDTDAAREAYLRVLETYPDYDNAGWSQYQLGRLALTNDDADEAIERFELALLNASRHPALTAYCYERLGFVYLYERRDLARALAFLNKAIDTYPDSEPRGWLAQVHTQRSKALRDMGRLDAALSAAENAVSIATASQIDGRSGLADASLTAAEVAAQIGGRDKDVSAYLQQFLQNSRRPVGIDVTWSRAYELLGDSYWRSGRAQEALAAYEASLQFNPYHPWELSLYYRMARCHYQMNEYGKAIAALDRMFAVASKEGEIVSDYRVYQLLANACYASEQYSRAVQHYQQAIDLAPQEADQLAELEHFMDQARDRASRA